MTHGSPVNISGKYFNIVPYGVDSVSHRINYDEVRQLALEKKPKMLVVGASAYPRTLDFATMGQIAKEAGCFLMVDMAHIAGLVAAGYHPSPIPHADVVTTTTHKTLRGPRGGMIMCKAEHAKAIDKAIFPGTQGGPLMHVIAAKAVAFKEALSEEFNQYEEQILKNAQALADKLLEEGFDLVSGGTDTHLMLVDLRKQKLTGKVAEKLLDEIGVTVNKNAIPFDPESPFVTSGIRVGTPAITSRGMKEDAARAVGEIMALVLKNPDSQEARDKAVSLVGELCGKYPLYADLG